MTDVEKMKMLYGQSIIQHENHITLEYIKPKWYQFRVNWAVVIMITFFAVLATCFKIVYDDTVMWKDYADKHCTITGHIHGSSIIVSTGKSIVPVIIPGKTKYACDDGQTHWR